jgi:hypothetical protein
MNRLHALAPLALAALTAGCAAPTANPPAPPAPVSVLKDKDAARRAEFDTALSRWHGASVTELTAKLGKPTTMTRRGDGSTVYAFTRAAPTDPGTGQSRFACTVSYVVDDKTQRVQSHGMAGC